MSQISTPKKYEPDSPVQADVHLSTQVLTLRRDRIVSYAGTSQFTAQGVSACGLAAFNFARIGFRIEQSRKHLPDILNELGTREAIEVRVPHDCCGSSSRLVPVPSMTDFFDPRKSWPFVQDGLVTCISRSTTSTISPSSTDPLISCLLSMVAHARNTFSSSSSACIVSIFRPGLDHHTFPPRHMKKIETSAVMIITRPPEIIACFKFANANPGPRSSGTLDNPLFVVFDSHPRPSHPHGAGLSFSTSIESTARTLSDILPPMDESIFDSSDFQWQAQLLANCSAHVYVGRHRRKDHEEAIVQSSLAILTLRVQISELKRENETLGSDKQQLQSEVDRLRASVRQEQMRAKREASSFAPVAFASRALGRSFGFISHAVAGPSRIPGAYDRSADIPSTATLQSSCPSSAISTSGAQSIFADNPPPVPFKAPPTYEDLDLEDKSSTDSDDLWMQTAYAARELQNEFDSEDQRLRQEHAYLARFIQSTFQCSICMDDLPEDDIAKVDDCVHTMCRSCLRMYISSKIQEHRYPILCPMCTISTESKVQPGGTPHVCYFPVDGVNVIALQ